MYTISEQIYNTFSVDASIFYKLKKKPLTSRLKKTSSDSRWSGWKR